MAKILILGGTRNLGHVTAMRFLRAGQSVSVLNRGITLDELPADVERLHAARENEEAVLRVVEGREWDVVVDTTSYTKEDAAFACRIFAPRCARMVFISTGQVYLVRTDIRAPFRESDYTGPLIPKPSADSSDYKEWLYGVDKRAAEDEYRQIARDDFPVVILRLPMIASERDHYGRIQGYLARIDDGGPVLVPDDAGLPIRHVDVEDAARFIEIVATDSRGGAGDYNVSCPESISLADFFEILAGLGRHAEIVRVKREILKSSGLLPACSPYSGNWMSELDSSSSTGVLQGERFQYTAPADYIRRIVEDYDLRWKQAGLTPPGYEQRPEEIKIGKKRR